MEVLEAVRAGCAVRVGVLLSIPNVARPSASELLEAAAESDAPGMARVLAMHDAIDVSTVDVAALLASGRGGTHLARDLVTAGAPLPEFPEQPPRGDEAAAYRAARAALAVARESVLDLRADAAARASEAWLGARLPARRREDFARRMRRVRAAASSRGVEVLSQQLRMITQMLERRGADGAFYYVCDGEGDVAAPAGVASR